MRPSPENAIRRLSRTIYRYNMIIMNIDVEDGLVKGEIGKLKYIEHLTEDEQATNNEMGVRPWVEFPNPCMGQLCRVKALNRENVRIGF
jgi:hypothetical protein